MFLSFFFYFLSPLKINKWNLEKKNNSFEELESHKQKSETKLLFVAIYKN